MYTTIQKVAFSCLMLLSISAVGAQNAQINIFMFLKGSPLSDIEITVDQEVIAVTDAAGLAQIDLPAGPTTLNFQSSGDLIYQHQFNLQAGELMQLLIDFKVKGDENPMVDVESSVDQKTLTESVAKVAEDAITVPVNGTVTDAENQRPVKGAKVYISGLSAYLTTNEKGQFSTELSAGNYNISVLHAQFNSQIKNDLNLTDPAGNEINIELTPAGAELPEFVVVEPFIEGSLASVLEERRANNSVANYLSMEQMSKSGDSDAAGALKRVTGLTLVDGRFIFIRGLGERYSSTLLNGANLPSPDPTRRVVPLDLFPTSIIESIEVQKGYASHLPAEFGGGTVVLRTINVPEENFLNIGLSYGHNSQTTGKKGLKYQGGDDDWTGMDDGTRALPRVLADAIAGDTELRPNNPFFDGGFSPEELEIFGESLNSNYDLRFANIDPGVGFDAAGGMRFDLESGTALGFSAALEYGSDFESRSELRRSYNVSTGTELGLESEENSTTTNRDINASGFLTTGIEFNDQHEIAANYMLLRSTQNFTEIAEGFNEDLGNSRRIYELRWTERDLTSTQFFGEHSYPVLGDLKLNWQFTDSEATFEEPDNRVYRYDQRDEGDFVFSSRNDSNSRVFRELADQSRNVRYDLDFPLTFGNNHDLLFQFGQNWVKKERNSDIRRFVFEDSGPLADEADRSDSLSEILNPNFIGPNGYQLIEVTRATDNYFANLDIKGTYYGIDYAYKEDLRFTLGARREVFNQSVTTFRLFDPDQSPVTASLLNDEWFPAFSSTWIMNESHQFRFNYSETATRPDFKELSSAQFKDPVLNRNVIGNPDLVAGRITHYDLRWDKYFSPGEFVSLSLFYKEFEQPIEVTILPGSSNIISFQNALAAENAGVELEVYKEFSFISERFANFYVSANYAYIDSEIQLDTDGPSGQTNNVRPLQGQSPYVANIQFGYDNKDNGINASLLFNQFGERISEAGTSGSPDIYEQPFQQVDFVYTHAFAGRWKLSFKAKNLLDDEVLFLQGDEITRTFTKGRDFSLGLSFDIY
ncbi:TonB-dependent receptor [Marinicella sp. S1101]|uniref:TonB-dependent receptor n=1 Tax=Marinicella marina TaxID=2996016 RepID=UPI002260C9B8|nr:TonB-dependent receptor [Marinicella marina]MCX7552385.1 TonB-dependent receptor [Marinicella marina]MDJ1139260.1 TonB-dependent receptor [Marinicella marina]